MKEQMLKQAGLFASLPPNEVKYLAHTASDGLEALFTGRRGRPPLRQCSIAKRSSASAFPPWRGRVVLAAGPLRSGPANHQGAPAPVLCRANHATLRRGAS